MTKAKTIGRLYQCNLCHKVVIRKSNKAWIPSICTARGDVMSRLYLVKTPQAIKQRAFTKRD